MTLGFIATGEHKCEGMSFNFFGNTALWLQSHDQSFACSWGWHRSLLPLSCWPGDRHLVKHLNVCPVADSKISEYCEVRDSPTASPCCLEWHFQCGMAQLLWPSEPSLSDLSAHFLLALHILQFSYAFLRCLQANLERLSGSDHQNLRYQTCQHMFSLSFLVFFNFLCFTSAITEIRFSVLKYFHRYYTHIVMSYPNLIVLFFSFNSCKDDMISLNV